MIAATESKSAALAHERTPLLSSPPPIISSGTSTDNSDDLKPVETGLGLPENNVACAKSGIGGGSSKGFRGVVAVMLLGSLSLFNIYRLYHHVIFSSVHGKHRKPAQLMIRLVIRCLHLQCRQYPCPCHVGDHLL